MIGENDKEVEVDDDKNFPYAWEELEDGNYRLVVIEETGESFPLVSVKEPFYPTINSNDIDLNSIPTEDSEFWNDLNHAIVAAQTDEEKKHALINSLGNIVLPKLNPQIQQTLNNNGLQTIISSLTYDDLEHLTDNEVGQIFYIKNKFKFTQPGNELFAGAGVLQRRQERFIIYKMKKFLSAVESNSNLASYLQSTKDFANLPHDELLTLLNELVRHCAQAYGINPPPVVKLENSVDPRFVAETSNSIPSVISFNAARLTKGCVNLVNLVGHEVTHAYYINRRFQLKSKQTPMPSSDLSISVEDQITKPAKYQKYSILVNSIVLNNQSDNHYRFRDISEKYARAAGLAAGIYAAKLIKSKNSGIQEETHVLADINPEHVDVTLEIAVAKHVEKLIGATLREIVTQPHFITATDKNNKYRLIGVTKAFNALVNFRNLYKNPLNDAFHIAAGLLNCLPQIAEKGSTKTDPIYHQCYLICSILTKPGTKENSIEIFKDCFEEAHEIKFSEDALAFEQNAEHEKEKLQQVAKHYPDPLCRKILLEAAWVAISEPKPPQLKAKLKQFIDMTSRIVPPPRTTRATRSRKA